MAVIPNLTQSPLLAGVVAVLIGSYVFKLIRTAFFGPISSIPGPFLNRFSLWPLAIADLQHKRPQYIHALHAKYGPVVRISPHEASITDLDSVKRIYATGSKFIKSPFYSNFGVENGVFSIFTAQDLKIHARKRRLLGGPISEGQLMDTFEPQIRQKVTLAIDRIMEDFTTHGYSDVFQWNLFMATDVIGELSFGSSFNTLESGQKTSYTRDLEAISTFGVRMLTIPKITLLLGLLKVPSWEFSLDLPKRMSRYARQSIARHQEQVADNPREAKPTLLSNLYAVHEKAKADNDEVMSLTELTMESRAYIIAGSDTTASSLTYLFWQLARNPEIQARLLKEVNALPANYTSATLRDEAPLLNNIINEILRLHAAVPSTLPRLVPDTGLQTCGHYIAPGAVVSSQAYGLHRDVSAFANPEGFNPDRWNDLTPAMKDAFRPWGGGSRICLGRNLALMEMRLATVGMLKRCPHGLEVAWGEEGFGEADMEMKMHFLMAPMGKRCLLRPRKTD